MSGLFIIGALIFGFSVDGMASDQTNDVELIARSERPQNTAYQGYESQGELDCYRCGFGRKINYLNKSYCETKHKIWNVSYEAIEKTCR